MAKTKKVAKKKVTKKTKAVVFDRHAHKTCDHKLKFCKHCDTAYCSKCSAEWKKQSYTWTSTSGTNQYLCGGASGTSGTLVRGAPLTTGVAAGTTESSATASGINTTGSVNHKNHK